MRCTLLLLPVLLLLWQPASAQDAHYWSNNYGPGVFLTPGSVIASNRDSGVLFYNPSPAKPFKQGQARHQLHQCQHLQPGIHQNQERGGHGQAPPLTVRTHYSPDAVG